MNADDILREIAQKDADIDMFAVRVLEDESLRDLVVRGLLSDENIMIYYHCFYIASKASEENPDAFYGYWDEFAGLLDHRNSYHRDFGLTLLANLAKVDHEEKFSKIFDAYLKRLNDEKFMTAECFVENLKRIIPFKRVYEKKVVELLCNVDSCTAFSEKQTALLKSKIIELFDVVYENSVYKEPMMVFVKDQITSLSPKTRRAAKCFISKYE